MNKLNELTPYVTSGNTRIKTVQFLGHSPKTPSWLAEHMDTSIQNISKVLRQLLKKKIVKRYLSNARIKSKFYALTDTGIEIFKNLENLGYIKKD